VRQSRCSATKGAGCGFRGSSVRKYYPIILDTSEILTQKNRHTIKKIDILGFLKRDSLGMVFAMFIEAVTKLQFCNKLTIQDFMAKNLLGLFLTILLFLQIHLSKG
jgi:hypothetical protein